MSKYHITQRVYVGEDCNVLNLDEKLSISDGPDAPAGYVEVEGWQITDLGTRASMDEARAYAKREGWEFDSRVGDDYEVYRRAWIARNVESGALIWMRRRDN